MYALYQKEKQGTGFRYVFKGKTHLFGCNSGYICRLLRSNLTAEVSEPYPWHINVEASLAGIGQAGHTLIINLKPNSTRPNLSFYEIVDVWGYSSYGWTPILFYLRGLFIDDDPNLFDEKDFSRSPEELDDPIFSMSYVSGTIMNGKIHDKWVPPGPSPTNSVLLWPHVFSYFAEKAKEVMDRMEQSPAQPRTADRMSSEVSFA
jgi:hypothetical protein